ncbi:hypothetical protein [Sphaerochaeta pleomorpha]|nr:hypothetical protein [Sphaerochaeta pleomorpha]
MRKKNPFSFILLLLSVTIVPLGASITATYIPDTNLYFTIGSSPFAPSDFIAHLGTLTFYIPDNQLFAPSLVDMTATNNFSFTGPVTEYNDWQTGLPVYTTQTKTGRICAVTTVKGKTTYKEIWGQAGTQPLTDTSGNINTSVFVAEIYLVGYQTASHFKPGAIYSITGGTFGSFNVAVAQNSNGIYNSKEYISVNGQAIPSNGSQPAPLQLISNDAVPLPYVDPDHPYSTVDYLFGIIEEATFNVDNAIGTKATLAAKAQLTLSNSDPEKSYGVAIKFEDGNHDETFSLGLDGSKSIYTIGYTLRFLSQNVLGGVPISWNGLKEGINEQNILITGINATEAALAPSGDYSDTIIVSVTPKDTL